MESENTKEIRGKLIRTGLAGIAIGGMATACAKPIEAEEPKTSTQSPMVETISSNPVVTESPFEEVKPDIIMTEELPDSVDLSVESVDSSEVFMGVDIETLAKNNTKELYTVVDKDHLISETFMKETIEPTLVRLKDLDVLKKYGGFPVLNVETRVSNLMEEDISKMMETAWDMGINVCVRSGFRSFYEQQYALDKVGGNTRIVELPGQSQHQTGLAVDFSTPENNHMIGLDSGFGHTEAGAWLFAHAWEYGFVNSYIKGHDGVMPEAEPHHYVYVGKDIASAYKELQDQGWEGDIFDFQEMIASVEK